MTKRHLLAVVILLAAFCVGFTHGPVAGILVAWLMATATLSPCASPLLRAAPDTNDIDADLNLHEILDSALEAFKRAILPLLVFSTVFRNVQLKGTNKVQVPYYPIQGTTSKDFVAADGYVFSTGAGSNTEAKEITINKRKYQPLALTSEEIARYPAINAMRLGRMKGEKLAFDVIQDILSLVTAANFGAAVFTGAASGFDSDDVIDIRTACNNNAVGGVKCPWPEIGRGLLLNPDYDGALFKDTAVKSNSNLGDDSVIREGELPRVLGFDYAQTAAIPANGENLVGMAVFQSALLTAFSPIEPAPAVRAQLIDYEIVTDPATGISIEYRVWGDPDTDTEKRVIECNYGRAVGEAAALKRLVSA